MKENLSIAEVEAAFATYSMILKISMLYNIHGKSLNWLCKDA